MSFSTEEVIEKVADLVAGGRLQAEDFALLLQRGVQLAQTRPLTGPDRRQLACKFVEAVLERYMDDQVQAAVLAEAAPGLCDLVIGATKGHLFTNGRKHP